MERHPRKGTEIGKATNMVTTPSRMNEQADRQRQREHFLWQERVAARTDLNPAAKLVLLRLALFHNVKTGRCDPSYIGLAAGAGVSERTAIRAVAEAEHKGLVAIERGNGRGNRNQFRFLMPPETLTPKSPFTAEKGDSAAGERVTGRVKKGDRAGRERVTQLCHPNTKRNMLGTSKEVPQQVERESDLLAQVSISGGGAAALRAAPAEEGGREQTDSKPASKPEAAEPSSYSTTTPHDGASLHTASDAYAELRADWQRRPWPDDIEADRAAFEVACQEVAPEVIIEAGRAWAAAVEARFLPSLAKWLAGRGWEKPPPKKRTTPHRRASQGRPRYNGKRNLADEFLKLSSKYVVEGSAS